MTCVRSIEPSSLQIAIGSPTLTWPLKMRISGGLGHLSNRQSAEVVRRAAGPHLRRVIATHLSRANNTPPLALASLAEALERSGWGVPFEAADPIRGVEAFDA